MALQTDIDELVMAWRALAGQGHGTDEGWRSIPLSAGARYRAGIRFPGNAEALLVGFDPRAKLTGTDLPQGNGFTVSHLEQGNTSSQTVWYALSRKQAGSLELFTRMAHDVIQALAAVPTASEDRLLQTFLARIRAWQRFMQRGTDGLLGPEEELGLVGELVLLSDMLELSLPADQVVRAWQGPFDSLQDFAFDAGGIEVKSTLSVQGFPARISSLEQLDDVICNPLYLAGVRLCLQSSGRTLPEFVSGLRAMLEPASVAAGLLEERLLHAGYLQEVASLYTRRFSHVATKLFEVDDRFPRLARSAVPAAIRQARYELDLDILEIVPVPLASALAAFGVVES